MVLLSTGCGDGSDLLVYPLTDRDGSKEDIIEPDDLAAALYEARRNRTPIPPLTDVYPEMTVEDAYAIQLGELTSTPTPTIDAIYACAKLGEQVRSSAAS